MKIKLLSTIVEGLRCTLIIDGETVTRRVYYRRECGLFIRHKNKRYFEYELTLGEEVTIE